MFKHFLMVLVMLVSTGASATTFEATAYVKDCPGCMGVTYWRGIVADPWGPVKIMAVDPCVLTLGKCYRLRFVDEQNDGHESVYLAADTGGDIRGHRIDLLLKSEASARKFGRQKVQVVGEVACPVDPHSLPRRR